MLTTDKLLMAGVASSSNATVQHFWRAVQRYNLLSRTTPDPMLEFIRHFWQIPDNARIRPDMGDRQRTGRELYYLCGDYRKMGGAATPLPDTTTPLPEAPARASTPAPGSGSYRN